MIAMDRGDDATALSHFDRALQVDPHGLEARRYRAILLARRGDWDAATREINRCLERDPLSAASLYAAACVVARAHGSLGSAATAAQALDLLERAIAEGCDPSRASVDPDLAAIRQLARFRAPSTAARSQDNPALELESPCPPPSRTSRSPRDHRDRSSRN